jgi:hypothetical protein
MRKSIIITAILSLFGLNGIGADTVFVNNLAGSASDISGIKNAVSTSYYQDFDPSANGNLNSLIMDLGLQQVNNEPPSSGNTMSIYLYSVNSSGAPVSDLATLASGLTVSQIEGAGTELGYQNNNDSFIYQYTVNLLNNPAISAADEYAILISLSSPGGQTIGWAEESGSDPEPSGLVGKLTMVGGGNAVGYGRLELDMTAVPEASTLMSGVACLGLLIFGQRKWLFRRKNS